MLLRVISCSSRADRFKSNKRFDKGSKWAARTSKTQYDIALKELLHRAQSHGTDRVIQCGWPLQPVRFSKSKGALEAAEQARGAGDERAVVVGVRAAEDVMELAVVVVGVVEEVVALTLAIFATVALVILVA